MLTHACWKMPWLENFQGSEILLYRWYVYDTFCLFHSEHDAVLFFDYINSRHPNINNVLFSSCFCLHWIFKFSNFSSIFSIFSIFLLVSRLRAGELSGPLGFLVSSPYNLSYEEKAGNYMVQITTIIKGLKNYRNNYSNN